MEIFKVIGILIVASIALVIFFVVFAICKGFSEYQKQEKEKTEKKKQIDAVLTSNEPTEEYNPDRIISGIISADYTLRKWRLECFPNCRLIGFDQISHFELIEDGNVSFNSSSYSTNGVSRALLGSLVAGDAGAIIGAATANTRTSTTVDKTITSRTIRIFLRIPEVPQYNIDIPLGETKLFGETKVAKVIVKTGVLYEVNSENAALEAIGLLESITNYDEYKKQQSASEDEDVVQLRKYKAMFDEGLITEEEYSAKKKAILNI